IIAALRQGIGENQMMAYLVEMAVRLVELHRVLKPTGSLYLHCDPTASHYLKVLLDGLFGPTNFVNEIIWKRSDAHSDFRQGAKHLGRDRKSTRLNSSHGSISYAVFCLKKKKKNKITYTINNNTNKI